MEAANTKGYSMNMKRVITTIALGLAVISMAPAAQARKGQTVVMEGVETSDPGEVNDTPTTCLITADGKGVKCWGDPAFGLLGVNPNEDVYDQHLGENNHPAYPLIVGPGEDRITEIDEGNKRICAIVEGHVNLYFGRTRPNDSIYCWGYARYTGLGNTEPNDEWIDPNGVYSPQPWRFAPTRVALPNYQRITNLVMDNSAACAVVENLLGGKNIWCWGYIFTYRAAPGVVEETLPVKVAGFPTNITDIAFENGARNICATTSTGDMYCVGKRPLDEYNYGFYNEPWKLPRLTVDGENQAYRDVENIKSSYGRFRDGFCASIAPTANAPTSTSIACVGFDPVVEAIGNWPAPVPDSWSLLLEPKVVVENAEPFSSLSTHDLTPVARVICTDPITMGDPICWGRAGYYPEEALLGDSLFDKFFPDQSQFPNHQIMTTWRGSLLGTGSGVICWRNPYTPDDLSCGTNGDWGYDWVGGTTYH